MVSKFIKYMDSIKNVETLVSLKEHLKNEVVKPMDWESRMDLYYQVQLIMKRIEQLQKQNQWKNIYKEMYG